MALVTPENEQFVVTAMMQFRDASSQASELAQMLRNVRDRIQSSDPLNVNVDWDATAAIYLPDYDAALAALKAAAAALPRWDLV